MANTENKKFENVRFYFEKIKLQKQKQIKRD